MIEYENISHLVMEITDIQQAEKFYAGDDLS